MMNTAAEPESDLDYHHYTLGRILFFLANKGLKRIDLDQSDAMDIMDYRRGDESEVLTVFHDVLMFMINEGIIRVSNYSPHSYGYNFQGVQLTSKGLTLIRANATNIDTALIGSIAANTSSAPASSNDTNYYAKWGEFAGSFIASATKSFGSG
jgi:hypothetical protein